MIYCFGDSLTKGRPGVGFIKYLTGKGQCVNCGVMGDTLIGVTARLTAKLNHKLDDRDYVILGVGTNDILQPYLDTCSSSWQKSAKRNRRRGSVPCKDINEFTQKYRELLEYILGITSHIVVFGLPLLETTENRLDSECAKYNIEIESICRAMKIPYIDIRGWQIEQKRFMQSDGSYFLTTNGRTQMDAMWDAVLTSYLPFAAAVSAKRGLAMTVDGCHFNELSAKGLAGLIERAGVKYPA